jgi:hypothetical protein
VITSDTFPRQIGHVTPAARSPSGRSQCLMRALPHSLGTVAPSDTLTYDSARRLYPLGNVTQPHVRTLKTIILDRIENDLLTSYDNVRGVPPKAELDWLKTASAPKAQCRQWLSPVQLSLGSTPLTLSYDVSNLLKVSGMRPDMHT